MKQAGSAESLSSRLSRRARESLVGRELEMTALAALLDDDGPLVVHLYGPAGVGKTTLVEAFTEQVRTSGATVFGIDCRLVEPTPRGFFDELGELTGAEISGLESAVGVLGGRESTVVLTLDHYEVFGLMDTWLRQTLLPALPDGFRLVIASRQPPVPLWLTSPQWHGLIRALAVEPLAQTDALHLLARSGIEGPEAEKLAAVTHGNPLALTLAASAAISHRSVRIGDAAIQEVMDELTALNLAEVEDPELRNAIRVASVVRRITRSLLRALAPEAEHRWEALRKLAFVDTWRDGLRVHDAVREALARTLRASDPERSLECRRAAWNQLRRELTSAPRSELWRYTADMLYLIENPVVREAFFSSGHQELAVEPAQADDIGRIRRIVKSHEGREAAAIVDRWWELQPGSFRVARNRDGRVVAFYCMCEARELEPEVRSADPVAAAWCAHLRANPIPSDQRALFLRRWMGEEPGEQPSPEQAACWLDVKRAYMELRPELRRVYLTVVDLPTYAPVATRLGFAHLPDATTDLDGSAYQTAMLDFGPASVDGWITGLVGDELGVERSSLLDRASRSINVGEERVALTPLEYKLVDYLEGLDGETATRDAILDEVWGAADAETSSNVVDAVVKSLRRKLGAEAGLIETVRGFGYRLTAV